MTVKAIDAARGVLTYEEWLRQLEALRIGYQRGRITVFPDGSVALPCPPGRSWQEVSAFMARMYAQAEHVTIHRGEHKPIDARAYEIARNYDGDKKKFTKIIAALVEHKD